MKVKHSWSHRNKTMIQKLKRKLTTAFDKYLLALYTYLKYSVSSSILSCSLENKISSKRQSPGVEILSQLFEMHHDWDTTTTRTPGHLSIHIRPKAYFFFKGLCRLFCWVNEMTRFLKDVEESFKMEFRWRIRTPLTSKPNHSVSRGCTVLKKRHYNKINVFITVSFSEHAHEQWRIKQAPAHSAPPPWSATAHEKEIVFRKWNLVSLYLVSKPDEVEDSRSVFLVFFKNIRKLAKARMMFHCKRTSWITHLGWEEEIQNPPPLSPHPLCPIW